MKTIIYFSLTGKGWFKANTKRLGNLTHEQLTDWASAKVNSTNLKAFIVTDNPSRFDRD